MTEEQQLPGAGSGPDTNTNTGTNTGTGTESPKAGRFDHECLDVYRIALEFAELGQKILVHRKITRALRDQFDRASLSIVTNIGEGSGKTAVGDKRRFYEIARGSTTETATLLDVLRIRQQITPEEYKQGRALLFRVAQTLSRLAGPPRTTR